MLCFVELKANKSDFGHATEQVINTYQSLKAKLEPSTNSRYLPQAFLIGHHGSSPMEHRRYQDRLNKVFKKDNYKYDGSADKFAPFLRGIERQGASRGVKKRGGDDSPPRDAYSLRWPSSWM